MATTIGPGQDGIFHAFHVAWIPELSARANGGIPRSAFRRPIPDQHAERALPTSLFTLLASRQSRTPLRWRVAFCSPTPHPDPTAGNVGAGLLDHAGGRSLRHVSGHRPCAAEIVSRAIRTVSCAWPSL